MDIMFVNKLAFFITISRKIKYGTIEYLPNRQIPTVLNAVKRMTRVYNKRGFQVVSCHGDGEFEELRDLLPAHIDLNVSSENESQEP